MASEARPSAPIGDGAGPTPLGLAMRRVMRQWATGVSILTVRSGDEIRGMTCNSFTSVSDSPATVLVCVRADTRTHALVASAGRFSISVLPEGGRPWADRFAGMHGDLHDKFDDVPHRPGPSGAPWLEGALGYFDCRIVASHPGGTHTIFVAELDAAEPGAETAPPLLRFRSQYTSV